MRGRRVSYLSDFDERTLADLAIYKDFIDPKSGRIALPTLSQILNDPRIVDTVGSFIEKKLSTWTGLDLRFRSRKTVRTFCGPTGWLEEDRIWTASLLAEIYFPERKNEYYYTPIAITSGSVVLPLLVGTYLKYASAIAAILERFFVDPERNFRSGWIAPAGREQRSISRGDWRSPVTRPNGPYEPRPRIAGVDWMEVYRQIFPDPPIGVKGLAARARRGRSLLARHNHVEFAALTMRRGGRAPRTPKALVERLLDSESSTWCERWRAAGPDHMISYEHDRSPSPHGAFAVRRLFRIIG